MPQHFWRQRFNNKGRKGKENEKQTEKQRKGEIKVL